MASSVGEAKDAGWAAAELAAQAQTLRDCRVCRLSEGRTQVVFGVGSPVADLMFVGEGPGFNEDRQGEPFVGQAGKLLTELLGSIGMGREDVYIANVVKCRPPDNRDPLPDEIASCSPNLMAQVRVIRPRIICTLGRFATRLIAETEASMTVVRGRAKSMAVAGVPVLVFPVFHPAAALYTPAHREVLQEDFLRLRRLLDRGSDVLVEEPSPAEPAAAKAASPAGAFADAVVESSPAAESSAGPEPPPGAAEQLPLW